eukprot:INCI12202.1.p1 GENE.INCI12202.1~~INCI12202.1.p1  ORF type:complete len:255 (-),score=52.21 INCI12202.1:56-820(-)
MLRQTQPLLKCGEIATKKCLTRGVRRSRSQLDCRQRRSFFFGAPPRRQARETAELADVAPATMFSVVKDVEFYQEFVPFCSSSSTSDLVLDESSESGSPLRGTFKGKLSVAYGGMYNETYSSRVAFDATSPKHTIRSEALDSSSFSHLVSDWTIQALGDSGNGEALGCKVACELEFEAKSSVLDTLLNGDAAQKLVIAQVEAFAKRAREQQLRRNQEKRSQSAKAQAVEGSSMGGTAAWDRQKLEAEAGSWQPG